MGKNFKRKEIIGGQVSELVNRVVGLILLNLRNFFKGVFFFFKLLQSHEDTRRSIYIFLIRLKL